MEGLFLTDGAVVAPSSHDHEVKRRMRTLVGMVFDERQKTKELVTRIEQIDSDMADANIQVKCRSCENYYTLDYDVSEFSADMSYCGGSPQCCP
jgi:hypothetical protein